MKKWLPCNTDWQDGEWIKFPILGTDEFCRCKLSDNEDEDMVEVMRYISPNKTKNLTVEDYLEKKRDEICPDCYYFFEIQDSINHNIYYLVTTGVEPWYYDWEFLRDAFCIPANPFNIQIFKKEYLSKDYV